MATCLVIDDASFDRKKLSTGIAKLGVTVHEAVDADEAISFCSKTMPDCVFIDWEMPGMKGIELLEVLRGMEGGENAFMVMCTSNDHPSFVGRAYIKGANKYIKKPVTMETLEQTLKEAKILGDGGNAASV